MRYPQIRYVANGRRCHLLHSYDGTCRGVVFLTDEAAEEALVPGRAEMDVVAIASGFLPRGATLVTRASAGDAEAIARDLGGGEDPLATIRLQFSMGLLADRSEWISHDEDVAARTRRPEDASRYEAIVDEVMRAHRDRGTASGI